MSIINCCQKDSDREKRAGHTLLLHTSNIRLIGNSQIQVIYTLADPRTNAVHYVGRSCNPKRRYKQHLYAKSEHCSMAKKCWMQELRALGLHPRMDIVETVEPPPIRVLERERRWLFHYIQQGAPLTNFEAVAHHYLVKAIQRTRINFLTVRVHSKIWYLLLCAEMLDLTELRSLEDERHKSSGRSRPSLTRKSKA